MKIITLILCLIISHIAHAQEPTINETIEYIKKNIDDNFVSKRIYAESCRSYNCITQSFDLKMDKYGVMTITEKVYDSMFKKNNLNQFTFNVKDVKFEHISNVAIIITPIASKNAIKSKGGNTCCERLCDWNQYHKQLGINTYDSEFSYGDQLKLLNAFKFLQEKGFTEAIEPEPDQDFFASKNFSNRNRLSGPASSTVRISRKNGVRTIKMSVNNRDYDGILDSGAATLLVTDRMVKDMLDSKFITEDDFTGVNKYTVANGQSVIGLEFTIPELIIGDYTLKNIDATVIENTNSDILIGQTVLNRFSKWEVDYDRHILIMKK
jgi:clan AA aspartic protease (TIGR02281 family)